MLFITMQSLPSFLTFPKDSWIPRLKPRHVPLRSWALQVLVLTSGSLMNNWVFAFSVPLTIQIVFRSAGESYVYPYYWFLILNYTSRPGSVNGVRIPRHEQEVFIIPDGTFQSRIPMCLGLIPISQAAVAVVSTGVILATLSRPSSPKSTDVPVDVGRYTMGIAMLTFSLFLTATLGVLQERTYTKYGPHWKEGVFYTVSLTIPTTLRASGALTSGVRVRSQHCLSLPIFLLFVSDLKRGFRGLAEPASLAPFTEDSLGSFAPYVPYAVLVANMITQLACVSGVNQLSAVRPSIPPPLSPPRSPPLQGSAVANLHCFDLSVPTPALPLSSW